MPGSNKKRGQTEVEVIRDWFVNIFMPLEKTADIVVTDFKFEQLSHLRQHGNSRLSWPASEAAAASKTGSRLRADPGVADTDSDPCQVPNAGGGEHSPTSPFSVLKKADVELKVGGKTKIYSVVIKVLPTDDVERHTSRRKFSDLLKFSKEVQVYCQALRCMVSYDEKRYSSACIEPPVPKCYLGQLDAQNDVLVLEDLGQSGYRKYAGPSGLGAASNGAAPPNNTSRLFISDVDHCRVVLRRLAHFHAFSTLIQRDADETLLDLFPFAVDASVFRESFQSRVAVVKAELVKYLVCNKGMGVSDSDEAAEKVERHLQDLFWKLVELRAQPHNMRMCVLAHGALDLRNIVFQYDETSGRPTGAKFLDFSTMTVSSPIVDISYFLHSSVLPEVAAHHHSTLLTAYHRAHLEAIKSFGMHGFEMELEDLLTEYHAKQDYGAMMACLLKPALYVLQCLNGGGSTGSLASVEDKDKEKSSSKSKDSKNGHATQKNGANNLVNGNDEDVNAITNGGCAEEDGLAASKDSDAAEKSAEKSGSSLKIDKNMVPVDLRLHGYLSTLAKACPCPCAVGSRELTIAELSADSLEELHNVAKQQLEDHKLKAFDCNGSTKSLKKIFLGFISTSSNNNVSNHTSSSSKNNDLAASNGDKTEAKDSKDSKDVKEKDSKKKSKEKDKDKDKDKDKENKNKNKAKT